MAAAAATSSIKPICFPIKFKNSTRRITGENKSKLLAPDSKLYECITSIRKELQSRGMHIDVRPPHIELLKPWEWEENDKEFSENLLCKRAMELEQRTARTPIRMRVDRMGRNALILPTGPIQFGRNTGQTHLTIAWFPDGLSDSIFSECEKIVASVALMYSE